MKTLINRYTVVLILPILLCFTNCKKLNDTTELTTLKMEDPVRHYSPIMQGIKQNIKVKLTNTGKNPLVVKNVLPSCGCTIAKFPSHGITPGNSADIVMVYDSSKNTGYTAVYTTISTNTKEQVHSFFFDINVVPNSLHTKDYEELHSEQVGKGTKYNRDEIDEETNIRHYETR
ncbi:hypothetical protein AMR72_00680 [Flavobacterium psychrophilum]|nr:hypothetical protein AMR72_00680 [Flavobacterium psychrophilum]AOE51164.1 hypothetical protein ALW18_00680 [Flavobacterium psychrophilum]